MQFDEPETAGRLNPRDIIGHLIMVWPTGYIPDSPTRYATPTRPSDAVVVDVVDLDLRDEMGQPGALFRGVWWRPSRLIQSLKGKVGTENPILAWMDQGVASQGMNAPFILTSATSNSEAVQRARDWLGRHPDFQVNPPQTGSVSEPGPAQPVQSTPRAVSPLERAAREAQVDPRLDRLARIAQEGADRLPRPPTEERIPF